MAKLPPEFLAALRASPAAERALPVPMTAPPARPALPVTLPPGNAGFLAHWLLDAALLPVPEIAVVTTLGILAGLCGRAYTTPAPHTGLNIYLILVARSATGKEALHQGASRLLSELRQRVPMVVGLINFDDYVSGPALAKRCATSPHCFVNFSSEFGRRIKRMSNPKDAPMADFRTTLTKLYSKSGPGDYVGDLVYSKERLEIPGSVACSVVGETTPGTLRAAMTPDMMEDGFLSRFGWVEYTGERPAENQHVAEHSAPPSRLIDGLAAIAAQALSLMSNNKTHAIQLDAEAGELLGAFKARCNRGIAQAGDNEAHRQVWSRANLKALKYAGLLAVADSHVLPVVTATHAHWAIGLVERDAAMFERSLFSGDVGSDATAQETKLLHILREYLSTQPPASYGVSVDMRRDAMVSRKYLQMKTSNVAAFKGAPFGASRALDDALRSLCDSGYIVEIDKTKAAEQYGFQGKCFRVVDLPR